MPSMNRGEVHAVADWSLRKKHPMCLVSIGFTGAYHLSIYARDITHSVILCMYDVCWCIGKVSLICATANLISHLMILCVRPSWALRHICRGPVHHFTWEKCHFCSFHCSIFQSLMFQKQQYTNTYTRCCYSLLFEFMSFGENETVTLVRCDRNGWGAWSTKFTKWQIKSSFEDIWLLSAIRTARSRASVCQSAAWKCDEFSSS